MTSNDTVGADDIVQLSIVTPQPGAYLLGFGGEFAATEQKQRGVSFEQLYRRFDDLLSGRVVWRPAGKESKKNGAIWLFRDGPPQREFAELRNWVLGVQDEDFDLMIEQGNERINKRLRWLDRDGLPRWYVYMMACAPVGVRNLLSIATDFASTQTKVAILRRYRCEQDT